MADALARKAVSNASRAIGMSAKLSKSSSLSIFNITNLRRDDMLQPQRKLRSSSIFSSALVRAHVGWAGIGLDESVGISL
ncbi:MULTISPECIES: hypothetical protein [Rhizobium]|uniref:hypothetical protein n=1 Tax=Rhizobium TaxID=379 RepID=UPI0013AEC834|nr:MULTISPECIES: hypothetical protein [Rhizobium]MDK4719262.1 hypothetical protein [Rhizobium sp. CNPSo 3968]